MMNIRFLVDFLGYKITNYLSCIYTGIETDSEI